ncbi:hypothetical protein ACWF9G_22755 [Nocardia sp. NPDC055029]
MSDPTSEHAPEITVYTGEDGATVVDIATSPRTGRMRVNVNDGPVYDGIVFDANPDKGDHHPAAGLYAAAILDELAQYGDDIQAALGQPASSAQN